MDVSPDPTQAAASPPRRRSQPAPASAAPSPARRSARRRRWAVATASPAAPIRALHSVAFTLWRSDRVRVTRGTELLGTFNKTGMSNRRFSTRCGGHLMAEHPDLGFTDVCAGVLPDLTCAPQVHLNYACAVLGIRDGLPKLRNFPAAVDGSGEFVDEAPARPD